MAKQNKDELKPVGGLMTAPTAPDGFEDWFKSFKGKRAHSRTEKELSTFKTQKNETDFVLLREYVYQGCFRAMTWDTDNAYIVTSGKNRRALLNDTPKIINALKQVEEFLSTYHESDGIGSYTQRAMLEKGHAICKEGGYWAEDRPILDMITSLKDVLTMIGDSDPKGPVPDNPEIYETWIYPSPGGNQYLCFRYPTWRDLSVVKRPSRQTALTVYLSILFRFFTAAHPLLETVTLGQLQKVGGKPHWKLSATICLCAMNNQPPDKEDIDIVADTSRSFVKTHEDISVVINW